MGLRLANANGGRLYKLPSHPRNKKIADIFFKTGYIEAWGRGISMMIDACRKTGLPELIIEEVAGGMKITFLKTFFPKTI